MHDLGPLVAIKLPASSYHPPTYQRGLPEYLGYDCCEIRRLRQLLSAAIPEVYVKQTFPDLALMNRDAGGTGRSMMRDRANLMFQTAGLLKRLADRFHLAVVVVNQVHPHICILHEPAVLMICHASLICILHGQIHATLCTN